MRVHVQRLFGKDTGIDISDVNQLFQATDQSLVAESDWLDYKGRAHRDNQGTLRIQDWKQAISAAAVAFLNNLSGSGGLIVVGVAEAKRLPVSLAPIPETEQKYEQLRSWLQADIQCVPGRFLRLDLDIVQVVATPGENVFLVEVHSAEKAAVYYSKSLNQAFQRRSDTSLPLSVPEVLDLVKTRAGARVWLKFVVQKSITNPADFDLFVSWVNDGITPGRDLTAKIVLTSQASLTGIKFEGTHTATARVLTPNHFDMEFSAGMPPTTRPVYPGIELGIGVIHLPSSLQGVVNIVAKVCESTGTTDQSLTLTCQVGGEPTLAEAGRTHMAYT